MRLLLLVIDGMADTGSPTPLEMAETRTFDRLAAAGKIGLLKIPYRKKVNSDFGFLHLLSSYSKKDYPGRGYLEALGIGLDPGKNDVCIRANWATLDEQGLLIDRRAGREELGLDELANALNMEIEGVRFTVKRGAGHRLVIIMSGKGLSPKIVPNDPMQTGKAVPEIRPATPEAKKTARLLNKFCRTARKILKDHPANRKRKFPANAVLIRNPGQAKRTKSFKERFGIDGCCIAGIPIAKGVARWLGLNVIDVKGATGMPNTDLKAKARAVLNSKER